MESSFLPCRPPTPNLFSHQNPNRFPSKPSPSTSPAQKSKPIPSTTTTHKRIDRHLNPLCLCLCLCHNGRQLQEAILALEKGCPITSSTYISLLLSCIDSGSIDQGRRLHAWIGSVQDPNPFIETKLVSMYAKCGSLDEARSVFFRMRERNLFTWSAMIGGCARQQLWEEVEELFFQMMHQGVIPDAFLLPKILQACANTGDVETGRLLHSLAVRGGFSVVSHVSNSILAMYAKCGQLVMARKFFDKMGFKDRVSWNSIITGHCRCGEIEVARSLSEQMRAEGIEPGLVTWNILIASYNQSGKPERAMELMKQMESSGSIAPDVVTWTSMISGLAQNNKTSQALDLFHEMQLSGVEPNGMTVATAISACASMKNLEKGKELHSYAVRIGSAGNVLVGNSLVDMYAKCGSLEDAERFFDEITDKDVFTWNSMIGGCMQAGHCGKAYDLFSKMEISGIRRNVVTWNAMISGYLQNRDEEQAMELFQRMETGGVGRNTASWNALIAGSWQNGRGNKALRIFRQMQAVCARPNSVTILSVLPACASVVSAWKVKEIHACILRRALQSDVSIGNALVDAYSKSGDIGSAQAIFNGLPSRDVISWNSSIAAAVLHGCPHTAQDLFHQMRQQGTRPNKTTFARMINAYSLSGMVNEGKGLFSSMVDEYQLSPGLDHYRGMAALFGRSGRLGEACDLIETMPVEPDFSVWDELFTAARIYGNIKLAKLAAENMIELEPRNVRTPNLVSLVYDLHGRWSTYNVPNLRKPKKESKAEESDHGCCWMEVRNGEVRTFLTGSELFKSPNSNVVTEATKAAARAADDNDLDIEEQKEEIVGIHSEKLAIAFALVNAPKPFRSSIRIVKSVRMCTDCHTATKLISKACQREILLKDPKCLHRFKDGECSCKDYW